jgi:hypothetical protein
MVENEACCALRRETLERHPYFHRFMRSYLPTALFYFNNWLRQKLRYAENKKALPGVCRRRPL